MPSALLVLLLLGSLAVDGAATFLAQRELADACAGAANDAATLALDAPRLYGGGAAAEQVDPSRAAEVAASRVAALEVRWRRPIEVEATANGPTLVLRLGASAPLPLAPPGARPRARVRATCGATSVRR